MRLSRIHFRMTVPAVAVCAVVLLNGCGDWCFAGFSNQGVGSPNPSVGNPSGCFRSQTMGNVRAVAMRAKACQGCADSPGAEHIIVTLRGVQLHANVFGDDARFEWLELDPQLAEAPRQIEVGENSLPEILVEKASIPPGYYREVRLQFFDGAAAGNSWLPGQSACGRAGWNCVVEGDGQAEPLHLPGETRELVVALHSIHGNALVVLPGATTELQLELTPRQRLVFSGIEGWKAQTMLEAGAAVQQAWTVEGTDSLE